MILMVSQKDPSLITKFFEAIDASEARQVNGCLAPNHIFKISIDRFALSFSISFTSREYGLRTVSTWEWLHPATIRRFESS